ncbi:ABC transporter permease [Lentzea tibetensis]|uniref:ABC transporter permease n=1 Tax=Lentzea tibetensis TaxID=2591470 RepID=A0A563F2L0_9PSEU|nr:ABC transporter permease [Lentzea tibetensis]TWP54153.1 ABC transporter permease [Lentzea tibetensis]
MTAIAARVRLPSGGGVHLALALVLVIGAVIVAVDGGNLLSQPSITGILHRSAALGIVAVGQTIVLLVGSLDLSVAYLISLCSLVAAETMAGQEGMVLPAVLAVLGVCVVVGLVNGLVVSLLRVNAFIATLGMALLLRGVIDDQYDGPAGQVAQGFQRIGYDRIGPIPVAALLMGAVALVAWFVLTRTKLGYRIYAVGGDVEVARLSGIRTAPVVVTAHVLCAVCAGVAGLFLASRLGAGTPTVGTDGGYDLESIAAAVLGGTALAGGKGGVVGTISGVLLLAVLDSVFNALEVDPFFKNVVRGTVIIVAVAVYAVRTRRPR